jgi:hypothetical protein
MNRRRFLQSSAATLGITAAGLDAALAAPKGPVSWKTLLEMSRIDVPTMANTIEGFNVRKRTEGFMRPEIQCMFREGEFDYIDFYRSPGFTVEKWRERNRKRG